MSVQPKPRMEMNLKFLCSHVSFRSIAVFHHAVSYPQHLLPSQVTHISLIGRIAHVLGGDMALVRVFSIGRRGLHLATVFRSLHSGLVGCDGVDSLFSYPSVQKIDKRVHPDR